MAVSCISCETKPDIGRKSWFFSYRLAFDTPVRGGGGLRRNIAIPFGMEKLEWWGYPNVKNVSKPRRRRRRDGDVNGVEGEDPEESWHATESVGGHITDSVTHHFQFCDFFGASWLFWLLRLKNTLIYLFIYLLTYMASAAKCGRNKKVSYRKQIARRLRTQYVELPWNLGQRSIKVIGNGTIE